MSSTVLGRVLVVDDEFQLLDALVEALNTQGYVAHGFLTGVDAIEALQGQEFDLLLTDLMMPGMDGITLLKACMAIDPNLMGIIMTGQGTVSTAVEAMKTGAFDYILKPFRLDAMLPVLARARELRQLRMENIQLRETVALYDLSQTIAFSLDSQLVLENTADAVLQQTDGDEVSIMLLTPDRQELVVTAVRGKDREHLLGQRVSMQDGIAGWVARQAEPIILSGEVSDPRFAPIQPRPAIRSSISMPLLAAGKMVGVLNVNRLQSRRSFTSGQMKALSILTSTAAAALENESLYRALETREKRFRILTENAPDGITVVDKGGMVIYVSSSVERILGYSQAEALGQPAIKYVHPDDSSQLLQQLSQLTNQQNQSLAQYRFQHRDGSWKWLESTVSNLIEEPGIEGIVFNYRDITERKLAEAAIIESERQMGALVTSLDDIVFEFDAQGTYINVWAADERMLVRPKAELLGRRILDVLGEEKGRPFIDAVQRVIAGAHSEDIEYSLDVIGGKHWFVAKISPILSQGGSNQNASMLIRDITERKQAEKTISDLARFPEENPSPIMRVSPDGKILYANSPSYPLLDEWNSAVESFLPADWKEIASETFATNSRQIIDVSCQDRIYSMLVVPIQEAGYINLYGRDITEQRQAEQAQRASEERFRHYFELGLIGMAITSPEKGFIEVNDRICEILGYERAELMQIPWDILTHPDDMAADLNNFNQLQAGQINGYSMEKRFIHKGGGIVHTSISVNSVRRADGSVDYLVALMEDITERKRAEAELQQTEAKYRTLVEQLPAIIYISSPEQGTLQYISPQVEELGYSQAEWLSNDPPLWPKLVHPDDLDRVTAEFKQNQILGQPAHSEYRLIARDDRVRWFRDESQMVCGESGQPLYLQGVMLDITERKQAEVKIRRQLERLSALRIIDMAISTSFDMKLNLTVLLNQAMMQLDISAATILLHNPDTMMLDYAVGKGFTSSIIEETHLQIGEGLAGYAALHRRKTRVVNLAEVSERYTRRELLEEEGFVSYYATPLIAKGELKGVLELFNRAELRPNQEWLDFVETLAGQAAIAIDNSTLFIDLQRANAELEQRVTQRTAELHQLNRELQHANRAKDEFLATMSHELRTPLNSILGLSESLLEETRGPLNERQQDYLKLVESSGQHLLQLINDVLDLSKIEAGKFDYFPQMVAVESLCHSSLAFVREQAARKSIRLVYEQDPVVSEIRGDPRRMKQMLVNLLTNAVKFTLEGGQVTLQVHAEQEKDLVQFSILDTGIGIAPDDLKKLFRPFVQVDSSLNRQYEGTGLGLALVQKMADVHGGSVEVESEVGKGSRFTINLPWTKELETLPQILAIEARAEVNTQTENPDVAAEPALERGVVLLAEDNKPNILTVSEYLESYGYEVVVAHDGWEALAKAEETDPDIILMDIQMPGMDGMEAMQRLRAGTRFAATPIIALTALAMPGDRERCLEAGATEYMSKPVRLKTLMETIHRLVGNNVP